MMNNLTDEQIAKLLQYKEYILAQRRKAINKYRNTEKGREKTRNSAKAYYYRKNDIYDPLLNPSGSKVKGTYVKKEISV